MPVGLPRDRLRWDRVPLGVGLERRSFYRIAGARSAPSTCGPRLVVLEDEVDVRADVVVDVHTKSLKVSEKGGGASPPVNNDFTEGDLRKTNFVEGLGGYGLQSVRAPLGGEQRGTRTCRLLL